MRTEVPFTLPRGYVDGAGQVHRDGTMRLATARDEIEPLRDAGVRSNEAYLSVLLLARTVTRQGRAIPLGAREFNLLEYLARNAGQVVTRTMMIEKIWNYHFDPGSNVVDVHIGRLRRKLEDGFTTPILHTVRGAGYRLSADA